MKYLVLGSSGQIGSALVKFLTNQGEEVFGFDIENDESEDLRNRYALKELIEKVDFIYFLAFDVGGSKYLSKYQHTFEFLHNNMLLQLFTFEVLKESKKPFIYASSQMSNMTFSPYGLSKKMGELYTDTLNGLTVKFWNVYGVEENEEKFHVITDFVLKAKKFGKIEMMTDGSEERQFLHAEDCSSCLYILSKKYAEIPRDKNLHITVFKWSKIIDVAKIVAELFGIDEIVAPDAKDEVQNNTRNEPDTFIKNYWTPQIELKEGIKNIIDSLEKK